MHAAQVDLAVQQGADAGRAGAGAADSLEMEDGCITHWWLKRYFYGPAGIVHMMPGAGNKAAPRDNDYAGKGASTLSTRCDSRCHAIV